jgi:hypothetical protein
MVVFEIKVKLGENEAQTVVEGIKQEVRNEFDSRKDTLSTKEDILNLKTEIERGFRDNLKWTVGTIIASAGIIVAIIKLL